MTTAPSKLSMDDPAAVLINERIAEQIAEILIGERAVRKDAQEAIHDLRVALRRLRIALITYRPFLDRDVTDPIGVELKWLGGKLSDARDAEVQTERLRHLNNEITAELHAGWRIAYLRATYALKAERAAGLLTRLTELGDSLPLLPASEAPINDVLPQQIDKAWRRMQPLVTAAQSSTVKGVRADLLHDVRKAAKRARYAAEPLVPLGSEVAERTVTAAKQIQTVLGEHQDAITAYGVLERLEARIPGKQNTEELWDAERQELLNVADAEKQFFELWASDEEFMGRSSTQAVDAIA